MNMDGHSEITLRRLATRREYDACVTLQRDVWGEKFLDVVPATLLMVSQQVGGVAVGAFDGSDHLLGFVFGVSGVRDGRLAHWSNMLAVRREARGVGLGVRLKERQRQQLLDDGIQVVYWSFDPLVARNANLNLNRLGAVPVEYIVDMYGDTGATLHHGLPTDRLIVEWRLTDPRVAAALSLRPPAVPAVPVDTPLIRLDPQDDAHPDVLPQSDVVRIAVPSSIDRTPATGAIGRWRLGTRRAFQHYFSRDYEILGFTSDDTSQLAWYTLESASASTSRDR